MATGRVTYKLGFRNQKPGKKVEIARGLANGLGRLPAEQQESCELPALQEKISAASTAMQTVVDLRAQLRAAFHTRDRAVREMCRAAEVSATRHAINVSYDPAQMVGGGLALQSPRQPIGLPGAPQQFRALRGLFAGSARLSWKRPVRRCVFLVEFTTDPQGQTGWERCHYCTAAKCELKDLEPGRLYWFRVAAVNAHGTGPWSQIATLRPG